ncbi:MAG: LLM class flavin-dependent oxidoreductase [Solirubrobacterales bacterium]
MPKPKVIVQLYPMLPTQDREDREAKRPVGRDSDLYHEVLHDWMDFVKAADEMGVWGLSTIEHHFHSEGYEVGPNPGVLNAWWASQVKNARIGAQGYVIGTQDPVRVAEECAILDHITKGKFFCGLARGYQSRWTNVLGQSTDMVAAHAHHIGEAADVHNRSVFEERVEMLLECWKEDSLVLDGEYYQAPYPLEEGIEYPAWESAKNAGAEGEIGEDGRVHRVSVVPKPYQDPHPPIFQSVSASAESISFAAKKGFRPTLIMPQEKIVEMSALYLEEAHAAGHDFVLGERQNMVRWIHVADSDEDYNRKLEIYDRDIYENFYAPFFPQYDTMSPTDSIENIKKSGVFYGGTVEKLTETFAEAYEQVPTEFITLIWHFAQIPKDEMLSELEIFMNELIPELEAPATNGAVIAGGGG